MALVLGMARSRAVLPVESVVLTGMAVGMAFTAGTLLVRTLCRDEYALGRMGLWATGGLWHVDGTQLAVFAPLCVATLVVSSFGTRHLDLLALGEADAHRLGLDVTRAGTRVLLLSCALTSLAVCIGGMVAFVGLVVPHAARRIVGPTHRVLFPTSLCLGAALVVAADCTARTAVPPQEIPLTVVTSLLGVPAFLLLLRSLRARARG
jgi:iron complex transport system permease protein